MIEIKSSVKELIKQFSDSILEPDFMKLAELLSEDGNFDIQDLELETIEVGKDRFIEWIWIERSFSNVSTSTNDQCLHCNIGAPVVLFDNGRFPRRIKDLSERSKTGLMLDIKDDLIQSIKFCYVFVKSDNKCMFELAYPSGK